MRRRFYTIATPGRTLLRRAAEDAEQRERDEREFTDRQRYREEHGADMDRVAASFEKGNRP